MASDVLRASGRGVMKIYRLYDPQEDQFVSSGRSLYAKNGRSHWANKSGAMTTKNNLPADVKERVVWVEYELVEVDREGLAVARVARRTEQERLHKAVQAASQDLAELE